MIPPDPVGVTPPIFSDAFIENFRRVLCSVFSWEPAGDFVVVRNWRGQKVLSLLPHVSYTHLSVKEGLDLASTLEGERYLIRVLDPERDEFLAGEPVTLRITVAGETPESLHARFKTDRMTRKNLNRAGRLGLEVQSSTSDRALAVFWRGLARTLHRLGAPMIPMQLISRLIHELDGEILLVWQSDEPVAGLMLLHDKEISWIPWSFSREPAAVRGAGDAAFVEAAISAQRHSNRVLDLGRSPYDSGPYHYKLRFGAEPSGIAMIRAGTGDPYSYAGAPQRLWRQLPPPVADGLGPRVCRILPEY